MAQLKIGMHVLRADGRYGEITGYHIVPGSAVMYNLTVAYDHTFVVGSGEWVVHNICTTMDARSSNVYNDTLRQEIQPTLDRIQLGMSDPHPNDGSIFENRPDRFGNPIPLPNEQYGYYAEYVHHYQGIMDLPVDIGRGPAGAMRIVMGTGGEIYFSPYHYGLVWYRLY
ncbi:MAG TPA: ribonuclease domain-containing protein [Ktedonobacteraceae bacterium]|nr:ribonuclease domain-containing protein [Ktedonobacteraceae bacterium]